MKRSDLIAALAARGNWQPAEAARMLTELLTTIADALRADGTVELRGFGVFETRHRKPRPARNINTGATVMIKPHRTAVFRPGKLLKAAVNQGKRYGTHIIEESGACNRLS